MKRVLALAIVLVPALALAQPRALRVRTLSARCGDATRAVTPATLRASSSTRGEVTITLSSLSYYCAPSPRFDAAMRDDGTIVLTVREPEPPVARCTCPHHVRLRVPAVPQGIHPIEVRFRDDVLARGEVDVPSVRRR